MNDTELCARLRDRRASVRHNHVLIAADRIEELKRDLNRANRRLGLYLHHASKKKAKR